MASAASHGFDGATIRRLRDERRWTQSDLVQELRAVADQLGMHAPGVNVQMVSRWENSKIGVSRDYRRLLDHVFTRSLEADDDQFEDAMKRRAFLMGSTAAVGLAVVNTIGAEPWQRLSATLQGRTDLDVATLDSLATLNVSLSEMFQPIAPRHLLAPARAHLDSLTDLLKAGTMGESVRQRVTSLAAEMSILLGWLNKEQGDELSAQQYFTTAVSAAVEAENHDLGAYAVASASTLAAFRSSPPQSLGLLTGPTIRGAHLDRANPSTQVWINVLQAEVHTRTGNSDQAHEALDRADDIVPLIDPTDARRPVLGFFDQPSVIGERGITAVRLRSATNPQPALDEALAALAEYPKTQSRLLTTVARSHSQNGAIDEACAAALQSLDVAERTGSGVGIDDVRNLRHELTDHETTDSVRQLDERLAIQI